MAPITLALAATAVYASAGPFKIRMSKGLCQALRRFGRQNNDKGGRPSRCTMDEVGIFRTTIGIENLARGAVRDVADALVDTGSELTWIPRSVLESIGVGVERRRAFIVADGRRVERDIGYAIIHAGGTSTVDEVVFAEATDFPLLGVRSLEGLNLRVDPVKKMLVDAGPVLAVAAA